MKKLEEENKLFVCQCGDIAHQLVISYFINEEEDRLLYCTVHLNKLGFWKRLWNGLKYIVFGNTSRFGDYEEFLFNPSDAAKLQEAVDYLKGK